MSEPTAMLDSDSVKKFHYLLAHCGLGLTEVRAISSSGVVGIGFFDRLSCLVSELSRLDGKANLYAGRNPRPMRFREQYPVAYNRVDGAQRRGGSSCDIEFLTCLYLDVDPVRERDTPSTGEEVEAAVAAAQSLSADFVGSVVCMTGNGAAVLVPVRQYRVPKGFRTFEAKCKRWEASLRERVETDGRLKLDFMQDLARIIRIPGTLNVKGTPGEERPHRRASFIGQGRVTGVLGQILSTPALESTSSCHPGGGVLDVRSRLDRLLKRWPKLRDTWNGKRVDLHDQTRSGYDMAAAALLSGFGWSRDDIIEALKCNPSGRGSDATDDYLDRTVEKALASAAR